MTTSSSQPELREVREFVGKLARRRVVPDSTALILVDLQNLDASPTGFHGQRSTKGGSPGILSGYFSRIEETLLPAVHTLQAGLRRYKVPTIYTVCASRARSLRDNGRRFRDFGIALHKTQEDAYLLPELTIESTDMVLTKTTASAFWSTPLERILRQMGIETLLVGGVVTSGCVESLVRDASDLDYNVGIVPEACADRTSILHADALGRMKDNFAWVRHVEEILDEIEPAGYSNKNRGQFEQC